MARITILDGPEPVRGRAYNVSDFNVSLTLRELIRGADNYNEGRIHLRVDGYPSAASLREQALAKEAAAKG